MQTQTLNASIAWAGPVVDAITVFVEPTPSMWVAEPAKPNNGHVFLYHALDSSRRRTGEVAGVHITGFLNFEGWNDIPDLPLLWQLQDREPMSLADILKAEQERVREVQRNTPARAGAECV